MCMFFTYGTAFARMRSCRQHYTPGTRHEFVDYIIAYTSPFPELSRAFNSIIPFPINKTSLLLYSCVPVLQDQLCYIVILNNSFYRLLPHEKNQ